MIRCDEWVHAQDMELVNYLCRVVTGIGGNFPGDYTGVGDGLLDHDHGLPLVRGLVGGPRRHDHLVGTVHHRLTVVGLLEVPTARSWHDAGLGSGEVALGLVVRHPGMLLAFGLGLFRFSRLLSGRLGLGFQRRHGLPDLLQPSLPKGQLLRQLVPALVLAVPPVLLLIRP